MAGGGGSTDAAGGEALADGGGRPFHAGRVLVVLLLPLGMALMAVSSVNVALYAIEAGLGASPSDIQWVLAGYALSFGIGLIPAGRAGDVLGRGSFFVVGLTIFILASLACGLAPTPLALNVARLVQGVGASIYNPQVTGMIQQYFTGQARARAYSLMGLVISASLAVGPLVSGAIISALGPEAGWRWAFGIYIPFGVLAVALAFVWLPFETERRRRRLRGEGNGHLLERIDLDPVGALLVAAAVVCAMLPFTSGGNPVAFVLLPVAAGLLWAWVRWERRYDDRGRAPLVDLDLFRYRSFRNGMSVSGVMFTGITSTFAVGALFLQSAYGVSPLEVGLLALPNAIASAAAAIWVGRHILVRGRAIVVAALACMVLGSLLSMAVVWLMDAAGVSFWWLALTFMLSGVGMGALNPSNQTLAMLDVPVEQSGTAAGVKLTVERIGTAVGTALITGVFFAVHDSGGWDLAFTAAFCVVSVILTLALLLAVVDARQHREPVAAASG